MGKKCNIIEKKQGGNKKTAIMDGPGNFILKRFPGPETHIALMTALKKAETCHHLYYTPPV